MTRRKKLTIFVVAILALAAAGVVAVVSLTPTMRSEFDQLREGMTSDEADMLLGYPVVLGANGKIGFLTRTRIWAGRDGWIHATFDAKDRLVSKGFRPTERPGFLGRLRSWFGL